MRYILRYILTMISENERYHYIPLSIVNMDPHICAVHSLNLVGKNAVESSTIVAILFAFIPNKYNLFIQTK